MSDEPRPHNMVAVPCDALAQLRRDRDELLAALETSVAAWDDHRYGYEGIEQARALIRRIKGTP